MTPSALFQTQFLWAQPGKARLSPSLMLGFPANLALLSKGSHFLTGLTLSFQKTKGFPSKNPKGVFGMVARALERKG